MPINITLRPGAQQFEKAREYFLQLSDLSKQEAQAHPLPPPKSTRLLPLVRSRIRRTILDVRRCGGSPEKLEDALYDLPHHINANGTYTFFCQGQEELWFEACILKNELWSVHALGFHLARMDENLYGLAVEGHGSYLIEIMADKQLHKEIGDP